MNPISVIWVAIICTAGLLPTSPLGVPWDDQWDCELRQLRAARARWW